MSTLALPTDGPMIATDDDVRDIIGEAFGTGAELVVIPAARLTPDFFRLGTGFAGEMLQKFTNYQLRVAIVGDISGYQKSAPLRDFVNESNRQGAIRFLASTAEL